MKLEDHPTVQRLRLKTVGAPSKTEPLDAAWLKQLVLDAGADDVGFVEIGRPVLDDQREDILKAFPHTKTLISFVVHMNRGAIRTPARSISNLEFHHSGEEVNDIARTVVQTLEDRGIRAMNPPMGFPMEMDQFPGKVWVVSHKPVAVAAGQPKPPQMLTSQPCRLLRPSRTSVWWPATRPATSPRSMA